MGVAHGAVESAFDADGLGLHRLFSDERVDADDPLARRIAGFDLTLNMLAGGAHGLKGARLAALTGGTVHDLDPRPRGDHHDHVTAQWRDDLRQSGLDLPAIDDAPLFNVDADQRAAMRAQAFGSDDPAALRIILHPGAGAPEKCWPRDDATELARWLSREGHRIRVLIGPVERERERDSSWEEVAGRAALLPRCPTESLPDLLVACDFFVGNDSGVSHVAAATGVPTIAIFRSTDPRRWSPLGPRVRTLRDCPPGCVHHAIASLLARREPENARCATLPEALA